MRCAPEMFLLVPQLVIQTSISGLRGGRGVFIHLSLTGQCIQNYIALNNLIM